MYQPSLRIIRTVVENGWNALSDDFKADKSGITEYLSGFDAKKRKNIEQTYFKVRAGGMEFTEELPREDAKLPAYVFIEQSDSEPGQFLGSGFDEQDIGGGEAAQTKRFIFDRVIFIETWTQHKEAADDLAMLLRYVMLTNRITMDIEPISFRNQRITQTNRIMRELGDNYPAEAYVRTLVFAFRYDEIIENIISPGVITDIDIVVEGQIDIPG